MIYIYGSKISRFQLGFKTLFLNYSTESFFLYKGCFPLLINVYKIIPQLYTSTGFKIKN